eukprot:gnl/TRDRNA2_/TRDRNA2_158398_c0_seq1.p2 gnl/TRDRNA2_/TRDRNA2_158398_c0~~gnl/TRDRNA2_/TRDRNA2_158398_c0_seq1.p2  ORF type:complete len:107 (+),score=14.95 gnl/TRDRNA2_/TRDRNA2_158398_c0_seq1:426-746(+)
MQLSAAIVSRAHRLKGLGPGYNISSCKAACDAIPECSSISFRLRDGACDVGGCQIGDKSADCKTSLEHDDAYLYSSCLGDEARRKVNDLRRQLNEEEHRIQMRSQE